MRIEEIDPNFKSDSMVNREDTVFYDVREAPFRICGLHEAEKPGFFHRMPEETAETVSADVKALNRHTAGGRVRFTTDSPYISLVAEFGGPFNLMPHFPLSGSSGFDLYEEKADGWKFLTSFFPDPKSARLCVFRDLGERKMRNLTLNFPLYDSVKNVYVGLSEDAVLKAGTPYRNTKPIVFYGSSITQGGCASRPGNCYQAILSHRRNFDYINLGFSGNAKGETAMVDYLKSLIMSIFVCDYDHNAPTLEHLMKTLPPLYRAIREAKPDLPIIFASAPVYGIADIPLSDCPPAYDRMGNLERWAYRRAFVRSVYEEARAAGDTLVRFVDGGHVFDGELSDSCTMETCHPNDIGFMRMANAFDVALSDFYERITDQ